MNNRRILKILKNILVEDCCPDGQNINSSIFVTFYSYFYHQTFQHHSDFGCSCFHNTMEL